MVYISDKAKFFFLSPTTCMELELVSDRFPTIGDTQHTAEITIEAPRSMTSPTQSTPLGEANDQKTLQAPCGCPKRTPPPPLPCPPVPPTDANRHQLQKFLLDYYKSSTFNICPHQPWLSISGPPMELMIPPTPYPLQHPNTPGGTDAQGPR